GGSSRPAPPSRFCMPAGWSGKPRKLAPEAEPARPARGHRMIVLAIDTAASLCAACLWDSSAGERGRCVLDIGKGHAEHLIGVIDKALKQADLAYAQVDAIAVSVGPGSFTGVRVGVSTARGLALALSVPPIGVTTLEALAAQARAEHGALPVMAALDGG